MSDEDTIETEAAHWVIPITVLSVLGVIALFVLYLYDALINGAYLGAYLPLFFAIPFLIFGRLLPEEYRGVLEGQIANIHLFLWINVGIYLTAMDANGLQYPASPVARLMSLYIALAVTVIHFIASGGGAWKALRRWRYCRARWRGAGSVFGSDSVDEITRRCKTETRMPTAEEHAVLCRHIARLADSTQMVVSTDVQGVLAERARAYADRMEEEARYLRLSVESMRLTTDYMIETEVRSSAQRRIAEIKAEIAGENT